MNIEFEKRHVAALKIQYFYRTRLEHKRAIENEKNRLHGMKGEEVHKNIFRYIIKYQYRKLKLHLLLKKLGKILQVILLLSKI